MCRDGLREHVSRWLPDPEQCVTWDGISHLWPLFSYVPLRLVLLQHFLVQSHTLVRPALGQVPFSIPRAAFPICPVCLNYRQPVPGVGRGLARTEPGKNPRGCHQSFALGPQVGPPLWSWPKCYDRLYLSQILSSIWFRDNRGKQKAKAWKQPKLPPFSTWLPPGLASVATVLFHRAASSSDNHVLQGNIGQVTPRSKPPHLKSGNNRSSIPISACCGDEMVLGFITMLAAILPASCLAPWGELHSTPAQPAPSESLSGRRERKGQVAHCSPSMGMALPFSPQEGPHFTCHSSSSIQSEN